MEESLFFHQLVFLMNLINSLLFINMSFLIQTFSFPSGYMPHMIHSWMPVYSVTQMSFGSARYFHCKHVDAYHYATCTSGEICANQSINAEILAFPCKHDIYSPYHKMPVLINLLMLKFWRKRQNGPSIGNMY